MLLIINSYWNVTSLKQSVQIEVLLNVSVFNYLTYWFHNYSLEIGQYNCTSSCRQHPHTNRRSDMDCCCIRRSLQTEFHVVKRYVVYIHYIYIHTYIIIYLGSTQTILDTHALICTAGNIQFSHTVTRITMTTAENIVFDVAEATHN